MHRLSIITGLLLVSFCAVHAQDPDSLDVRKAVLEEARYLKSIYKTAEVVEKLSTLVRPEVLDE